MTKEVESVSIGERIEKLRKEQNISQGQIAEALNISRQAVSKWENDLASPDTLNLIKLADLLDTQVEFLATGKNTLPPLLRPPVVIKQIETVEKIVEVEKIVTVDKPVYIDRPIETERIIETPVVKRVFRTKYVRNPIEYFLVGLLGIGIGLIIGAFL